MGAKVTKANIEKTVLREKKKPEFTKKPAEYKIYKLNRYSRNLSVADSVKKKDQLQSTVLCQRENLARTRFLLLNSTKTDDYVKEPLSKNERSN